MATTTQPARAPADTRAMTIEIAAPVRRINDAIAGARVGHWAHSRTVGYDVSEGGPFAVDPRDPLPSESAQYVATLGDFRRALARMAVEYPDAFADIMRGDNLPDAGNTLIQLATLGERRYV